MARPIDITESSAEVTKFDGTAGVLSPFLYITTPKGATYRYPGVAQIILKLFDAGGVQLPKDARLVVGRTKRGDKFPTFFAEILYSNYYDISAADQRNVKYQDSIRQQLGGFDEIVCRENDRLEFWVESSVAVDKDQAATRFNIKASIEN